MIGMVEGIFPDYRAQPGTRQMWVMALLSVEELWLPHPNPAFTLGCHQINRQNAATLQKV
jgi:hypothetical protein